MLTDCHCDQLTRRLAERIDQRAGHTVNGIVVAYCHDRVQIRGIARSYYAWQLAIAASRELLMDAPHVRLECLMKVEKAVPS